MPRLTIVIPTREPGLTSDNITLSTLQAQTWRDFAIVISIDPQHRGAPWARNVGARGVNTELIMFCDDDIQWRPDALQIMVRHLDEHPEASYVYCAYRIICEGRPSRMVSNREFDPRVLRGYNYISTMSIIRTVDFPGFDESIPRFQDWDVWLTMLKNGKVGVYARDCLYSTLDRPGITNGNPITPEVADSIIKQKHKWMKGVV